LETRNAGVTAKRSDAKREAFAFVDDQETLAADFVSDWSDGHLIGFLFEVFRIREPFPFAEKRLAQTHANTKKKVKKYFLAHAFILLTSPRNRIQCGSPGDSQIEKIFQKHLCKISVCDFQNQFCNFPPARGRGMLLLI
jgi:hypothetical protein